MVRSRLLAAMPRDELGLDPYQAAAVSCAKQGAITAAILVIVSIGLVIYTSAGGGEPMYAAAGGGCFVGAILSFFLANRRLSKEDIRWADVC